MSVRMEPEQFFRKVSTREPNIRLQTEPQTVVMNTSMLVVLGIISIVALIGFFAYLATDKKCRV